MQPVEPSTIVRGPEALTMSFMTNADSQPWQVRWPEEKYSLMSTFLTPFQAARFWVSSLISVSGILSSLLRPGVLLPNAQPVCRLLGLPRLCRMFAQLNHFCHVLDRHLATSQATDESDQRWSLVGVIHGCPNLGGSDSVTKTAS